VEGADSVEISSTEGSAFQFHAGPFTELTGEAPVDNVTTTTEFIITASKTVMVAAPATGDGSNTDASGNTVNTVSIVVSKAGQLQIPEGPPTPSLSPQTVTATEKTTVTVVESNLTADITADKDSLIAGESTIIHWKAEPSTAQVTVKASDSSTIDAQAEGSCTLPSAAPETPEPVTPQPSEADAAAPTAAAFPVEGCAVVTPLANTTYSLEATDSGKTVDDAVTIQVTEANVSAKIFVNGEKNSLVSNYTDPVSVTWSVSPAAAIVTVTATPSAVCDLPLGVASPAGNVACTISAPTTFKIHAEMVGHSDDDEAYASLKGGNAVALNITTDPWAFVSEQVNVNVKAADATSAEAIQSIKIGDAPAVTDKAQIAAGITVRAKIPNTNGIMYQIQRTGVDKPDDPQPIPQTIIQLQKHEFFHATIDSKGNSVQGNALPVTRVTFDPNDLNKFYYGVQREKFGEVSVYRLENFENSGEFTIGIDNPLKTAFGMSTDLDWGDFFTEKVKTYPVGAIAVRVKKAEQSSPAQIFAATTGIIMVSQDDGGTWKRMDAFYYNKKSGYVGDHDTCAGKSQSGLAANEAKEDGSPVTLGQICDMIAKADGTLMVAYDRGVLTTASVDDYIADPKKSPWIGKGNNIYNTVAHDLEEAGERVFVATNKGVYVNETGDGATWASFAGGALDANKKVYSLAYDYQTGKLYGGADDGVYVTSVDAANWEKTDKDSTEGTLNERVLSLVIDPYYDTNKSAGVVIAGTATKGVAVTRDGGKFWSVLDSDAAAGLSEVRSVALAGIVDTNDSTKVTYKISAGGNGAAVGSNVVGATAK
jgi:hypothetical protein